MQIYDMNDLAESRADAEEGMLDTCEIVLPTGERVFNKGTGKYEEGETPLYTGKCKLKNSAALNASQESALAVFTVERLVLYLPFGPEFKIGAVVRYLTSDTNPNLVGNVYRVTGLNHRSQATAQRLNVELVSS